MAFGAMCKSIKIYVKYCNFYLCGIESTQLIRRRACIIFGRWTFSFLVRQLIIYICLDFFFCLCWIWFSYKKQNSISEVQNQLWHELEYLFIVRSPRQARSAVNNDKKKRGTDETCYVAMVTLHSIKYSPRSDHHLVQDKYM